MKKNLICPSCGGNVPVYANPQPTADILIHDDNLGVVIIERKNTPLGYALPGGFIDEGEYAEHAAVREAMEETSMTVKLEGLLGVYSRPDRDPRSHTLTSVYVARAVNPAMLRAADDAGAAAWHDPRKPPEPMCFDHARMLRDFVEVLEGRRHLAGLSQDWLDSEEGRANAALAPASTALA
ncbi:MAG: NUDIX hydrolase [Desulfovibrionaceae bacterium]|nr:NUDIX hydrolase [Desulfovibrionaceae bacterium]